MSSGDKKNEVATQKAEDGVPEKEKASGDSKSDTSPHKRSASEVNSVEDDVKQKIQKTDHKGSEKENGESEEKFDDGDDGDDDDDDVVPEGEDFEEEEDGVEEDGDDDDEDDA